MSHLLSNYELRVLYEYLSEDLSPPAHILTLRNRLRLSLQQPTNPLGHGIVPDAHQNWANFQGTAAGPESPQIWAPPTYVTRNIDHDHNPSMGGYRIIRYAINGDSDPSRTCDTPMPTTSVDDVGYCLPQELIIPTMDRTNEDTSRQRSNTSTLLKLGPQTKQRRAKKGSRQTMKARAGGGGGGGNPGGGEGGGDAVNWDPECRRGGYFLRQPALESLQEVAPADMDEVQQEQCIPENAVLSPDSSHFLSRIAAACRSIVSSNADENISPSTIASSSVTSTSAISLLEKLVAEDPWKNADPFFDNSLASIVQRCKASEDTISCAQLVYFLNLIQFRTKVESLKRRRCTSARQVMFDFLETLKISRRKSDSELRTLQFWMMDGAALCLLAGAGSIYLIVIMACIQIKSQLRRLSAVQVVQLFRVIRSPSNDTPAGRLIISDIIPAISILRSKFSIKFTTMFASTMLRDFSQPLTVMSDNIIASDAFFDCIAFDTFLKPRNWEKWASCRSLLSLPHLDPRVHFTAIDHVINRNLLSAPVLALPQTPTRNTISMSSPTRCGSDHSPPLSPLSELDSDFNEEDDYTLPALSKESDSKRGVFIIETNFDPAIKSNKVALISSRKTDEEIFAATEELRRLAKEYAVSPEDMSDLKRKQLHTGARSSPNHFIRISSELLQGKPLRINDKNGNMLVIIDPTMPDSMRGELVDRMFLVFEQDFKFVDTEKEGFSNMFPSMHYSLYNRYSVQGENANVDKEPIAYQKPGRKRRMNTSQLLPRASKEMQTTPKQYELLHSSFEDIFQWQSSELKDFLPQVYEELRQYVDKLPANEIVPAYPFAGFVLNLNVSTRVHRDRNDKDVCLIIVVSQCVGGALILSELGLVLDLDNGDGVLFQSSRITHCNSHFQGLRASFVFHTDRAADAWTVGRKGKGIPNNGWANNKYFRQS